MADTNRTMTTRVTHRRQAKLPSSVIEEHKLVKGSPVNVMWGKNYTCVIILPSHVELTGRMLERATLLVNESLDG